MLKLKRKPHHILITLIILFAIPIYLAIWMYRHDIILSGRTTNHGTLIQPPLSLKQLQLSTNQKWTLMLFEPSSCSKICRVKLHYLRQMQKASGKNQNRVQRMVLTFQAAPELMSITGIYPNLLIASVEKASFIKLINTKKSLNFATQANTVFIADPNGNIMMAYPPNTKPMNIFKDLKHLLRLSQIG